MAAVAAITVLGAALRFATLGSQSFSGDEGVTVLLLDQSFGGMLGDIPESESTPPLYYVLAWLWTQMFGTGEAGVRSLSAVLGTAVIPVAYLAARTLVSRRAGLIAAALAAASPLLVWYSQEARAYSLLVLLTALSLLFFFRCLQGERGLGWWAVTSALALATHYYAAFLVVPEAIWLVASLREQRRAALAAAAALLATGLLLLPLALDQRDTGNFTAFIADIELSQRLKEVPKKFAGGEQGTPGDYGSAGETLLRVALLLAAAGIALLLARGGAREKRGATVAGGLAAAAIGVPVAMALAGFDYFAAYLLIAAWIPAAIAVAAGFAGERAGRLGFAGAGALVAVLAAMSVYALASDTLRRPDFEAAASAVGEPSEARALVLTPDNSPAPLEVYGVHAEPFPEEGAAVDEIVLLGLAAEDESTRRRSGVDALRPPVPGFTLAAARVTDDYTLVRFEAERAVPVSTRQLEEARLGEGTPAISLQR